MRHSKVLWNDLGFTLPELTIIMAIMGILAAIAIPAWGGMATSRQVDAGTDQVVADMRLAHNAATNRLGTARLIFRNDGNMVDCDGRTANYCLTMPRANGTTEFVPRDLPPQDAQFPQRVRLNSPNILADPLGLTIPGVVPGVTSTLQFTSDGRVSPLNTTLAVAPAGACPSTTPTTDANGQAVPILRVAAPSGNPRHCITFNGVTARTKID